MSRMSNIIADVLKWKLIALVNCSVLRAKHILKNLHKVSESTNETSNELSLATNPDALSVVRDCEIKFWCIFIYKPMKY